MCNSVVDCYLVFNCDLVSDLWVIVTYYLWFRECCLVDVIQWAWFTEWLVTKLLECDSLAGTLYLTMSTTQCEWVAAWVLTILFSDCYSVIDWLSEWLTQWATDSVVDYDSVIDWLSEWLTQWAIDSVVDYNSVIDWLSIRLAISCCHWV